MSFFWVGHFEFFFRKKIFFFCFIPMKISPNLYGRMDGSKFWYFPWFPENSLLCVILHYTVYTWHFWTVRPHICFECLNPPTQLVLVSSMPKQRNKHRWTLHFWTHFIVQSHCETAHRGLICFARLNPPAQLVSFSSTQYWVYTRSSASSALSSA